MSVVRTVLAGVAGFVSAFAGVTAWMLPRSRRITPAERERRRRLAVNARGRTGSAWITEVQDGLVCYRYWIGGVEYAASQDVSTLKEWMPPDPAVLIERPAAMKYLANNPANSIVVCEGWSGMGCGVPGGPGRPPR